MILLSYFLVLNEKMICILKDLWPVHFFRDVLLPWLCRCLVTTMLYRITEFFPVLRENLLFLSLFFLLAQPLYIRRGFVLFL